MESDKRLRSGNLTWVNHVSEMWAFKVHLKIAFSYFDPSWNQTKSVDLSFCRDIHFQDFEDLSSFRFKIKFAKSHFGSEKHTLNIHVMFLLLFSIKSCDCSYDVPHARGYSSRKVY